MNTWADQIANSIPEHSEEVKTTLVRAINYSPLDEVDAHACALVAAISAGNGELAFEISMNGPLMGKPERELAKKAASVMSMSSIFYSFVNTYIEADSENLTDLFADANVEELKNKFEIYALAASITNKCDYGIKKYIAKVTEQGLSDDQIHSIGIISAVVSSIGKIAL